MSKSGSIKYIAIYLNEFSDFQFQADEPTIRDWSQIGTRRIWNYRNSLKVISPDLLTFSKFRKIQSTKVEFRDTKRGRE